MTWDSLFPRTFYPWELKWPPSNLNDLTDAWLQFTILVSVLALAWALLRTIQSLFTTKRYLDSIKNFKSPEDFKEALPSWVRSPGLNLAPAFREILIEVPEPNTPPDKSLRRTANSSEIFSPELLAHGLVGNRMLLAVPAILTGLGVLGTFVGLQIGIGSLDLSASQIANLDKSIAPIISGCSTAFSTSVWGVFCSLVFTIFEKLCEWIAVRKIRILQSTFDGLVPRYTPEESMVELHRSSLEQEKIINGLAVAIGDAMQKAIDRLGNSITDAVEKTLGDGASDLAGKSAEMMAKALTDQLAKLENSMKEISTQFHSQFGETNKNLTETISQFEIVLSGVDETVKSSQAAVTQAVGRLSAQEEVVKSLEAGASALKDAAIELALLRDTFTLSAEKNQLAATAQQDASDKNQAVAIRFEAIGEKLPEIQQEITKAAAVIASLGQPILELEGILRQVPDIFRKEGEKRSENEEKRTTDLLSQTQTLVHEVKQAAEQFSKVQGLAEHLERSAGSLERVGTSLSALSNNIETASYKHLKSAEASEKAAAAGERAAIKLEPIPSSVAELAETLSQAGGKIKLGADSANGIYLQLITYQKQWFDGVKLGLTSMREQLQAIIEQYGDSVSQETQKHMNDWTKAVNESLGKFSSQVDALKEDINSLEETIEDLKTDLDS
jgi:hypothetical protein